MQDAQRHSGKKRRGFFRRSKSTVSAEILPTEKDRRDAQEEMRSREESVSETLVDARQLWAKGHESSAIDILRQARLTYPAESRLAFALGYYALEQNQTLMARIAFQDAVDLDVTNLDALEHFLETNHSHPAPKGATTKAITALALELPLKTGFDADASTFLVPSARAVDVVDERVRKLKHSEDPVARQISTITFAEPDQWGELSSGQSEGVSSAAGLTVSLANGAYHIAFPLLAESAHEWIPRRPLRIAIRREVRRGEYNDAHEMLKTYRRLEPEDPWSTVLLESVAQKSGTLSHSQLATRGFPFPNQKVGTQLDVDQAKVLYLLHTSLPYHSVGYATRTHGLLRGVRGHGWEVHGVTRLGYPYDMPNMESLGRIDARVEVDDVPYHRLSTAEGIERKNPIQDYVERYSQKLSELVAVEKPFAIHAASNHWNGLTAISTARRFGLPSIYEVRGLWEVTRGSRDPKWMNGGMFSYMARMETDAAKYSTQVITITAALRNELVRRGVDQEKITVVPNGVETERFAPRPRSEKLAARLGMTGKTVIGYVGSILDYEGIGLLIDAAAALKTERNDFAFLLVGDGAELAQFSERVESENLVDVVLFTGRVPHHEVEDYYSIIDICPFPRLPLPVCEMVSPLKPFEAMAMGKAVIASDVAALSEVVSDGENGLLHEKGSAISLTNAIRDVLDNPELRTRLATGGLNWVRAERDWRKLSETISEIYQSIGGVRGN